MRSLPSAFLTSTNFVVLAEVYLSSGTLYRALHHADVTFNGQTYTADNGAIATIAIEASESVPGFTLSLQNVRDPADTSTTIPWSTVTDAGDINGTRVALRTVSLDALNDSTAQVAEERWYIGGWELDRERITFNLGGPFDALALEVVQPSVTSYFRVKDGNGKVLDVQMYPSLTYQVAA